MAPARRIGASSMPRTRWRCHPSTRRISFAGCGSRSRRSPRTTTGSRTKVSGRSVTSSTSARSSAPPTGRPTRRSTSASPRPLHEEITEPDTPVFIQDYHLALVAPGVRRRRPAARTALFWHIPWPYPDRLRICPWRRDILTGLLANDLLAFQLERDRRNFLLAVEEELDAQVEARVVSRALRGPIDHGRGGADWRRLRPHPGHGRRRRARG